MDLRSNEESTRHSTATDQDHMDIDVEDIRSNFDSSFLYPNCSTPLPPTNTNGSAHPDEATLANYIETLLRAVDRIRSERDDLRRALEFSETEARITIQTLKKHIHTVTQEADRVTAYKRRSKRLVLSITALSVVVNHLRSRLHAAEQNQVLDHSQSVAERDNTLRDLQSKFEVSCQQLTASEGSRNQLLLLITELEVRVQSLTAEVQAAESSHEDTRDRLQQAEEQLAELTRAYQNIESERNSLNLQVTNLQTDLEVAQEELTDAHSRYSALQAQQLSTMSATGVAHALREQIQELEGRVNRRTEQIGLHQHDIRRLETNLKLQEERISETMSELEMMSAQKEAMVEDCAEARDARDQAVNNLEVAELEVEKLQEENDSLKATHSDELSSMVAIVAQAMSNARRAQCMVDQHLAEEPQMLSKIAVLEAHNSKLSEDMGLLANEKEILIRDLAESVASLSCLEALRSQEHAEMGQLVASLATAREALSNSDCNLEKSHQDVAALQAQLSSCRCALEDKAIALEARDARLAILEQNLAEISNESAAASTTRISEYQGRLQSLEDELDELRTRHQITCESLSRAQDDLQQRIQASQVSESNAELQDLHARHAVEVRGLQERLKHTSQELSQATQLLQNADLRFAEVQQRNQELDNQIVALTDDGQRRAMTEDALRVRHVEELDILQKTLFDTQNELAAVTKECQRLASVVEQSTSELELARQAHTDALRQAEHQVRELQDDREEKVAVLEANERDLQDFRISLDEQSREQDLLRTQLQNEITRRKQDQAAFNDQLSAHADRQAEFDALKAELRQADDAMHWRLEQAEAELSSLQAEKQSLQVEITSLEAEVQRSISLTRYLEQQVQER
jgi:chromosome segregation ATPase